ncbi:MAG TPA: phage minor capsid protein [Candidatus Paceibacterota bacterium]|nr:phage minor capsid protein [Candidatus Paceibacterota bacterium]
MNEKQIRQLIATADVPGLLEVFDQLGIEARNIVLDALQKRLTDKDKRKAIALVKAAVETADTSMKAWLLKTFPTLYLGTMKVVSKNIDEPQPDGITGVHKEAVNALMEDSYLDFAGGMQGVVKSATHTLNDAMRQQIRAQIVAGELKGDSVHEVADKVEQLLKTQGFTALIDRAGRKWELTRYADMLAHTHIMKAANDATVNRAGDFNIDIVEITSHGATDMCGQYEGKIFSLSGNSENYPTGALPPYHPNCRHSIILRPDLS